MLGVRVTAWPYLPMEEVYVCIGVTHSTVIVYEIVKRVKGSGSRRGGRSSAPGTGIEACGGSAAGGWQ